MLNTDEQKKLYDQEITLSEAKYLINLEKQRFKELTEKFESFKNRNVNAEIERLKEDNKELKNNVLVLENRIDVLTKHIIEGLKRENDLKNKYNSKLECDYLN